MQTHSSINVNYKFWKRRKSISIVRQADQSECGLACLTMLTQYFGKIMPLNTLRMKYPASVLGTRLSTLIKIAGEVGILCRPVKLDASELSSLKLPCILHWNMDHYVVCSRIKRNSLTIYDPAAGRKEIYWDDAIKKFTGIAVEVSEIENYQAVASKIEPSINWLALAGKLTGFKRAIMRSLILALLLEIISLSQPLLVQIMVDNAIIESSGSIIAILSISLAFLTVSSALFFSVRSWNIAQIQTELSLSAASNIFLHLLKLPATYFERRRLGDVVGRFNTIETIQKTLSVQFVEATMDGIVGLLTLIMMVLYSPVLTCVPLLSVALILIVKRLLFNSTMESNAQKVAVFSRQQNRIIEAVRLSQTIRINNSSSVMHSRFSELSSQYGDVTMDAKKNEIISQAAVNVISGLEKVLVVSVGGMLALKNSFSVGSLVAFLYYSAQFSFRSRSFIDYTIQLYLLRVQKNRLSDIILHPQERNLETSHSCLDVDSSLSLSGVGFQYSSQDPWIFKNINLEIKSGGFLAIVGPSGCGKSTLIKLLLGTIRPSYGQIKVGGVEISLLGFGKYRDMLGVALQDGDIFAGSVYENVTLFDDSPAQLEVEKLCELMFLHKDIISMPMGYNTKLGGIDSYLSAGQKQRLILARALYRRPKILILDEATCHIDIETESSIVKNIKARNITCIMVTHRTEVAGYADQIYDVKQGAWINLVAREKL